MLRTTSFLLLILGLFIQLQAQKGESVLLWPEGAPGALGEDPEDQPKLDLYLVKGAADNTPVVVICPGGGYWNLAMDHEGDQIARWFQARGVHAFVLSYRLAKHGYKHPSMLYDAQRGLRYVRAHADKWGIDKEKVGILGFSAGGHLASTASTHFDKGNANAKDPIDREHSRPNYAVLAYPVIAFGEDFTHKGSQRNLIGKNPSAEMIELLSNEKQVTSDTPPSFLVHTSQDKAVPPENSIVYYLALRKAGVPAELHIYQEGRHGLGMINTPNPVFNSWADRLEDWLRVQGVIK
ncbi:MAG: alpha/beta hydrolase [Bacteroidota bacterium]